MILPTKYLREERTLLSVGANILRHLDEPKTVSRIWNDIKKEKTKKLHSQWLTYDWFILSLDLLYVIKAIDFERGRIRRLSQ